MLYKSCKYSHESIKKRKCPDLFSFFMNFAAFFTIKHKCSIGILAVKRLFTRSIAMLHSRYQNAFRFWYLYFVFRKVMIFL